jgi:hypothetical protein
VNPNNGLVRDSTRRCPFIVTGLSRAGFRGGWLKNPSSSVEIRG